LHSAVCFSKVCHCCFVFIIFQNISLIFSSNNDLYLFNRDNHYHLIFHHRSTNHYFLEHQIK
jgi:hypothetical protein